MSICFGIAYEKAEIRMREIDDNEEICSKICKHWALIWHGETRRLFCMKEDDCPYLLELLMKEQKSNENGLGDLH